MTYIKVAELQKELTERGYTVKDSPLAGHIGQEFIEFLNEGEEFCVGPCDGFDVEHNRIFDSSNLWVCHKKDFINRVYKNDKALPNTDDIFVLVNSLEAWVMRESLFTHAIPM